MNLEHKKFDFEKVLFLDIKYGEIFEFENKIYLKVPTFIIFQNDLLQPKKTCNVLRVDTTLLGQEKFFKYNDIVYKLEQKLIYERKLSK
jgi:hypothetical protein